MYLYSMGNKATQGLYTKTSKAHTPYNREKRTKNNT